MTQFDKRILELQFPDWRIDWEYGYYTAVHNNFEASWEGEEDGWVGNGLNTSARSLEGLKAEIEAIMEEHPHFQQHRTLNTALTPDP